jgi:hypothetical protein
MGLFGLAIYRPTFGVQICSTGSRRRHPIILYAEISTTHHFFFEKGVPASASIDAYGFLLKILKYPHYYSSRIREGRYMNHPSKNTTRPM